MKKFLSIFFLLFFYTLLQCQEHKSPKTQASKFLENFYYTVNFGGIF